MPIIKSAKKRVRVASKAAARNSKTKRNLKASLKLFAKSPSFKTQSGAVSNLDKALKKGVIHKNGFKPNNATKTTAPKKAVNKPATKKAAPKK
jgi:small subunit ribosomal protein S20